MSYEAVRWAMYDAPMLRTPKGDPDTTARAVLIVRAERADKHGRDTYAGPDDVARATGYNERTVRLADRRLEQAGLLIRDGLSRHGTVRWHLDMKQKQSGAEPSPIEDRAERQRKANAARQQRFRDRLKATAEIAQSIEPDVSSKIHVTPSESVTNAVEERYVTPFKDVSNALSTLQTTLRTTQLNHPGTTPGGAPPPDPRRPEPPTASGSRLEAKPSISAAPHPAQDQQRKSLPRTRAPDPAEYVAPVVDFFTREVS